ncbi:MAG: diguanylate cyclase [Dehalococcoidia bacterium]|nr:diguanylate cyclase [Dehalococcoidia bacterium]
MNKTDALTLAVLGAGLVVAAALQFVTAGGAVDEWQTTVTDGIGNLELALGVMLVAALTALVLDRRRAHLQDVFLATDRRINGTAMRDNETGLFNRQYFYDRLKKELVEASHVGQTVSVAVLSIGNLETLRQLRGAFHAEQASRAVSRVLRDHLRVTDVPAHLSDNQFAIMLADTNRASAETAFSRLDAVVESMVFKAVPGEVDLYLRGGIAECAWGQSGEDLVRAATLALISAVPGSPGVHGAVEADEQPANVVPITPPDGVPEQVQHAGRRVAR